MQRLCAMSVETWCRFVGAGRGSRAGSEPRAVASANSRQRVYGGRRAAVDGEGELRWVHRERNGYRWTSQRTDADKTLLDTDGHRWTVDCRHRVDINTEEGENKR